ncbi:MAG: PolC-type DNA polymerase III, partial [Dehalococcoidia bacterium]
MSTYVALDLETTGLDPSADAIIEIGAVKFKDGEVSDRFQTLVKPHRPIPEPVQTLTGIGEGDVRDAPTLEVVAGDLEAFLGDHPLVGHNIVSFDARLLDAKRIRHSPVIFDTYDLASLLLPGAGQYSLLALAERFEIPFPVQHRALPDAQAAGEVFQALQQRAVTLP